MNPFQVVFLVGAMWLLTILLLIMLLSPLQRKPYKAQKRKSYSAQYEQKFLTLNPQIATMLKDLFIGRGGAAQ
jgi:hypothetical protein